MSVLQCQSCRTSIRLTGIEALRDLAAPESRPSAGDTTARQPGGNGTLGDSFVVLDEDQRTIYPAKPAVAGSNAKLRSVEESFVVLADGAASRPAGSGTGPAASAAALTAMQQQGLHQLFATCAQTLELASTCTQVDQPVCLECAAGVAAQANALASSAEREAAAYEAALARLQAEPDPMSAHEFSRQLRAAEAAELQERECARRLEEEVADAERQLSSLQQTSGEVAELEERYWQAFNQLGLQLDAHLQDRDAALAKIEAAGSQLEALRRTSVWNDVFHIWHTGPFATIGGFRLGRTPAVPVPWEEVNAAWGHAVLLLHTLAQVCQMTFSQYRLLPMGSYPRVADARGTHHLYGPANRFVCTDYDRAQVAFLACLKEFAAFARARDVADGRRECFELPYAIDGDRVGGHTIKLIFNKDAKWSKALKYMAADLKWALKWVITANDGAFAASLAAGFSTLRSTGGSSIVQP